MTNSQIFPMDEILVDFYQGQPITRADFRKAFDLVCDKANWKNPIAAEVVLEDDRAAYILKQAVIFFTASIPEFFNIGPNRFRVVAAGYYVACGA